MMYWASRASSRGVITRVGSGSPVELEKYDFSRPSSRARLVIMAANLSSEPAMPSASAMQASLPDCTITLVSRSCTRARLWIGANMLEVCEGAPPCRQAYSLTSNSVSGLMCPSLSS